MLFPPPFLSSELILVRAWIDGGRRLTYDPLPTSSSVLRDEPAVVVAARVAVVVAVAVVREWHGVERLRPPEVLLLPACVVPESQQHGHDFMLNSGFYSYPFLPKIALISVFCLTDGAARILPQFLSFFTSLVISIHTGACDNYLQQGL